MGKQDKSNGTKEIIDRTYTKMTEQEQRWLLRRFNIETFILSLLALFLLPVIMFFVSTRYIKNIYEDKLVFCLSLIIPFLLSLIYTIKFLIDRKVFSKISQEEKVKLLINQYKLYTYEDPIHQYKNRYYVEDKESRGAIYVGVGCLIFIAISCIYALSMEENAFAKIGILTFVSICLIISLILVVKCIKKPNKTKKD